MDFLTKFVTYDRHYSCMYIKLFFLYTNENNGYKMKKNTDDISLLKVYVADTI